jgi:hypothetical protein
MNLIPPPPQMTVQLQSNHVKIIHQAGVNHIKVTHQLHASAQRKKNIDVKRKRKHPAIPTD